MEQIIPKEPADIDAPSIPVKQLQVKKYIGTFVCIIFCLLIGLAVMFFFYHKKIFSQKSTGITGNNIRKSTVSSHHLIQPAASKHSVFVFENFHGNPLVSTDISITDTNGNILHQLVDTPFSIFSSGDFGGNQFEYNLLLNHENNTAGKFSIDRWSLLHANGTITQLFSTFVNLLHNLQNPQLSDMVVTSQHTLLAAVGKNDQDLTIPFHFSSFDLNTGTEKVLFTIYPTNSPYYPFFQPAEISPQASTASFLVSDVIVNSTYVAGTAVVTENFVTNTLSIHHLPPTLIGLTRSKYGQHAGVVDPIGLSPDGNILIYEVEPILAKNGTVLSNWSSHILNLTTNTDIPYTPNVSLPNGYTNFFFTADNAYFITFDNNIMDIIATASGSIVYEANSGNKDYTVIQPVGWTDKNTLLYLTQTTDQADTFDYTNARGHLITVGSHKEINLPNKLGEPVAVLSK